MVVCFDRCDSGGNAFSAIRNCYLCEIHQRIVSDNSYFQAHMCQNGDQHALLYFNTCEGIGSEVEGVKFFATAARTDFFYCCLLQICSKPNSQFVLCSNKKEKYISKTRSINIQWSDVEKLKQRFSRNISWHHPGLIQIVCLLKWRKLINLLHTLHNLFG